MSRGHWLPAAVALMAGCGPDSDPSTAPESTIPAQSPEDPALALSRTTTGFVMVTAGESHTCALTQSDVAWCWGQSGGGLLGNGENGGVIAVPARVSGTRRYVSISAAPSHTCGVARTGRAFCWGSNLNGQLGTGTSSPQSTVPAAVAGGLIFQTVAAGGLHTCGIDLEGQAWCWGNNSLGQVGDGTSGNERRRPVRVLGQRRFARISVGALHTCAVGVGGKAFCWGEASGGRLGLGLGEFGIRTRPTEVTGGLAFGRISAGSSHTCGLVRGMTARCWGGNAAGQVGDGTTETRVVPTIIADGLLWEGISAGTSHTCGVTNSGRMLCWGSNLRGQLGDGIPFDHPIPAPVAGDTRFRRVSSGDEHSCGISADLWVYCWGTGLSGQLGHGTATGSPVPVPIADGS